MATGEGSSVGAMHESEGRGSGLAALSGAGAAGSGAGAGGIPQVDMTGPAPTFLVVNADDLGYDASRDVGLVRSFTAGMVTSASLLVNGASAASGYTAAAAAGLPVGLHLNLTEGRPVAAVALVASLVDPASGLMLGKAGFRDALARGSVDLDEVAVEVEAQLRAFKRLTGASPIHADGHQHIHTLPRVRDVIAAALCTHGVKCTRIPYEPCGDFDWLPDARRKFYGSVMDDCQEARAVYAAAGVQAPTAFIGYGVMGADMSVQRLTARIQEVVDAGTASCELMVHPGLVSPPSGAGCGGGVDEFAQSPEREHELAVLAGRELKTFIEALVAKGSLKIVSYAEWAASVSARKAPAVDQS